jgi:hypothetical protein
MTWEKMLKTMDVNLLHQVKALKKVMENKNPDMYGYLSDQEQSDDKELLQALTKWVTNSEQRLTDAGLPSSKLNPRRKLGN